MIIRVEYFYFLLGVMLALVALMSFRDRTNPRRWTTGLFWTFYATVYLVGERLPPAMVGLAMIVMALLAGFGGVRSGKPDVLPDGARQQRRAARAQAVRACAGDTGRDDGRFHPAQGRAHW